MIHDLGQLGPIPKMNRQQYRRASAMARPGQRKARAGCATGNCGSSFAPAQSISIDGPNGRASFPIPAALNQPFDRKGGSALRKYRPLTSMVGQVMSSPGLAAVGENDPESQVMIRATNLSSVVAVILTKLEGEERKAALAVMGGDAETGPFWAESVLNVAKKMPGGLGVLDAIRFSLALHYMIGIADDATNKPSAYATAYRQAVKVYRDAEKRVDAKTQTQGLGSVRIAGASPLAGGEDCAWYDAVCGAKKLGKAIAKGAEAVAEGVKKAGEFVMEGLGKAADWFGEIVCKGFKAILPDPIGGFLCSIFTTGLELLVKTVTAMIQVIIELVDGLKNFVVALVKGDIMGAAKALLVSVTTVIFLWPPIGPFFSVFLGIPLNEVERKKRGPDAPKSLVQLGKDIANRNPLFILGLVMAIIAVITGPGLNSIGGLVLALSIAVAVVTAAVFHNKGFFKDVLEDRLVTVIDKIIRITVVVVMGVMKLIELFKTFSEKLENYAKKKGGAGNAAKAFSGGVMKRLSEKWNKFWDTLTGPFRGAAKAGGAPPKKFSLSEVSLALSQLFAAVPEVIIAMVGEDEDLKAAADAGKEMMDVTVETIQQAREIWTDAGKPLPKTPIMFVPLTEDEQRRLMAAVVNAGVDVERSVALQYRGGMRAVFKTAAPTKTIATPTAVRKAATARTTAARSLYE